MKKVISLKVESLIEFNSTFLILACKKKNYKVLLDDWNQLLESYQILCDLHSTVEETTNMPKLQKTIESLDKGGDLPYGQPNPNFNSFVIIFTEKYFEKDAQTRKAIILHELGHFYVYQAGILENLRNEWIKGQKLFDNFVTIVKQDMKWYCTNEKWLRDFYTGYVFDMLKVPGEIFANFWVKDNFNLINLVVETQLENYESIAMNIGKTSQTKLVRFPLLTIILRLHGLLLMKYNSAKIQQVIDSCWKKMSDYVSPSQLQKCKQTQKEVMAICGSTKRINQKLFNHYSKFVKNNVLTMSDFT